MVTHHRVVTADAASALVTASGRAAAVVVGRHQSGGLLGSVSRTVIQHADCPVFLVG